MHPEARSHMARMRTSKSGQQRPLSQRRPPAAHVNALDKRTCLMIVLTAMLLVILGIQESDARHKNNASPTVIQEIPADPQDFNVYVTPELLQHSRSRPTAELTMKYYAQGKTR